MDSITNKEKKAQWYAENKERVKEYNKKYRAEHKEQSKKDKVKYYAKNKVEILQRQKVFYQNNKTRILLAKRIHPEIIEANKAKRHNAAIEREKEQAKLYRERNKEKYSKCHHDKNKERKLIVLDAYGNKCVCCGESEYYFLAIDHVNGGGGKMRKKKSHPATGYSFYGWLIENNFPKEFQILCHNCNMAKGILGYCPHEGLR